MQSSRFTFHPGVHNVLSSQFFLAVFPFPLAARLEQEPSVAMPLLPARPLLLLAAPTCTLLPEGPRDGLFLRKARDGEKCETTP